MPNQIFILVRKKDCQLPKSSLRARFDIVHKKLNQLIKHFILLYEFVKINCVIKGK